MTIPHTNIHKFIYRFIHTLYTLKTPDLSEKKTHTCINKPASQTDAPEGDKRIIT